MTRRRVPPWAHFAAMVNRRRSHAPPRNYDAITDGPDAFEKKARVAANEPPRTDWLAGFGTFTRGMRGGRVWRLPGGGIWYKGNRP